VPIAPHLAAQLQARFASALAQFNLGPSQPLGLAVSGGGDSAALLHLAHRAGLRLRVATVDHGLREGSAAEARAVAGWAGQLGYAHDTLHWQGWNGRGNVQDRARRARRALLADWAQRHNLTAVALAHTRDDLAEGMIMRLARGAGVDGLAAMQPHFTAHGTAFVRPLLWAARADLRNYLHNLGAGWVDDPSNEMTRFDRIRARKALPDLAKLGLGAQVLADVAQHMAQARGALDYATASLARDVLHQAAGIVTIASGWLGAPPELQRRLIQRVILWIAPADYAPRGAALAGAIARISAGLPAQLGGCHFVPHLGQTVAFREARRAGPPVPASGASLDGPRVCALWDGLWRVAPESGANLNAATEIRALGTQGLAQWPHWREVCRAQGLPRAALLSQPSLWAQDALLGTPLQQSFGQNPPLLRCPAADSLFKL